MHNNTNKGLEEQTQAEFVNPKDRLQQFTDFCIKGILSGTNNPINAKKNKEHGAEITIRCEEFLMEQEDIATCTWMNKDTMLVVHIAVMRHQTPKIATMKLYASYVNYYTR